MTKGHFIGDRHALYVGWVCGIAMRNGIYVRNVLDDDGNYTDRITVELYDPTQRPVKVTMTLVIPPPPDDWVAP